MLRLVVISEHNRTKKNSPWKAFKGVFLVVTIPTYVTLLENTKSGDQVFYVSFSDMRWHILN